MSYLIFVIYESINEVIEINYFKHSAGAECF